MSNVARAFWVCTHKTEHEWNVVNVFSRSLRSWGVRFTVHLKKFSAQLAKFHSSFSRLFFFSSLVCSTCVRLDNYLFVWRSVMNSQWKRRLYIFFVCFIHSSPRFRVALLLLGYQVQSAKKRRKFGETNAIWNSDWLNGRRRFHSCFLLLCFFSGSCAGCGLKKSGARGGVQRRGKGLVGHHRER